METKANYVAVGVFTILAIFAAFAFVYWTAGLGDRGDMTQVRFRIPGSAAGLTRGSAVLFNGVRVGSVENVYIDHNNPTDAIADARVVRTTPITRSTQAVVGIAGLTMQANIELKGGSPGEPNLLQLAEEQDVIPEITTSPSAVTDLLQTAQSLMSRADAVVSQLEGFVSDARGPLTETVRNVETFSSALSRNAEGIDTFLENVSALSESIGGVSSRLDSTLQAAEELIGSVDRDRITKIVENVETFTEQLAEAGGQLETVLSSVDRTVTTINGFSEQASATLERFDKLMAEVEPSAVGSAVRNFEEASAAINRASSEIARVSETVGGRTEDIDQFISDAQELASRLNAASVRVDGVLAKLDGLLGSGESEDLMAQASATLTSFRNVADTLNARIGPIADGLTRFSGQGLRDVEGLISEARRSISRIEGAITSLEQNPQRIITGGDGTIRRYDGRARR